MSNAVNSVILINNARWNIWHLEEHVIFDNIFLLRYSFTYRGFVSSLHYVNMSVLFHHENIPT